MGCSSMSRNFPGVLVDVGIQLEVLPMGSRRSRDLPWGTRQCPPPTRGTSKGYSSMSPRTPWGTRRCPETLLGYCQWVVVEVATFPGVLPMGIRRSRELPWVLVDVRLQLGVLHWGTRRCHVPLRKALKTASPGPLPRAKMATKAQVLPAEGLDAKWLRVLH